MTQKTYWHLLAAQRMPTDYELLSSKLLYYLGRGFEVELPTSDWYRKYQTASPLKGEDWERFKDPRETTYSKYMALQSSQESFVDGLLESIESKGYDKNLNPEWVGILSRVLAPMRYPCHGLQMVSSYLGSMAPGSRIAIAALFQSSDELRRVQRAAYRMRQLQNTISGFGDNSKKLWQEDPMWQPMRKALEQLLATYDWGESFTALNLVFKPVFDELFGPCLAQAAKKHWDPLLAEILFSLHEDSQWHRSWSRELVRCAIENDPANAEIFAQWIKKWTPLVLEAARPIAAVLNAQEQVEESLRISIQNAGLEE